MLALSTSLTLCSLLVPQVHLQVGQPSGSCTSPAPWHLPGVLLPPEPPLGPLTFHYGDHRQPGGEMAVRPPPLPQQNWAWETLPDSPQDVSSPVLCPSHLWPPLLFPAPGGKAEPGWELLSRAFTFPFPSPIFKSFSSKMIRQVGAALPVGCRTSPSHGMHAWPQALASLHSHHSWGRVPSMLGRAG